MHLPCTHLPTHGTLLLVLLASICANGCGDSKDNKEEACSPYCLSEKAAIVCINGEEELQSCGGEQKCFEGACSTVSTETCTSEPPQCLGTQSYRICNGSFWSNLIPCNGDTVCQDGKCVAKEEPKTDGCTATQPECSSDGKGYRVCVSGNWSDVIPCAGATTCKNGQCSGEDVTSNLPCSTVGDQKCVSDSRIQICGEDKLWRFMDCPADIPVCYDDECNPPECTNGEIQCLGDSTLATCVNSTWKSEKCPTDKPLCQNSTCVERPKECTPGQKKCISEKQSQKCNTNGIWEDDNFCSGTSTCFEGECMEKCSPGEKKCVTDSLAYVCSVSGYWESKECTGDTVCSDGECKACKNGDSKCQNDTTAMVCENGAWKTAPCKYLYCSDQMHQCIEPEGPCSGVESYCMGNTLVWCDGTTLNAIECYECASSKDKEGATCTYNNLAHTGKGFTCDTLNATKSGAFAEDSSYNNRSANCIQCKKMDDKDQYYSYLWVPVPESNCK